MIKTDKKSETMENIKKLLVENGFSVTREISGLGGRDLELDVFNSEFRKGFESIYINITDYDIADKYIKDNPKQA